MNQSSKTQFQHHRRNGNAGLSCRRLSRPGLRKLATNAKKLMPTISSARTAHLSIRPYALDGNGSDRCFFGRHPVEPTIAVDGLSRMITSFIIHDLDWPAGNNFDSFAPYSDYPLTGLHPRNAPTGISRP
jgi:hypothetical protein